MIPGVEDDGSLPVGIGAKEGFPKLPWLPAEETAKGLEGLKIDAVPCPVLGNAERGGGDANRSDPGIGNGAESTVFSFFAVARA